MGGIGVALAVQWLISRVRPVGRALLITIPLWALASSVAIATGLSNMTPSTRQFMDEFWGQGFLPLPLTSLSSLRWFADQAMSVFTDPTLLRYRWPAVFLVVAALGLVALWQTRRHVALLLFAPMLVALTAAVAHQYPFRGRLMVYLIPGLLLAIAAGAEWMRRVVSRLHPALGGGMAIALLAPPVAALVEAPPPYDIEHHRTVLRYLQGHRQPGDVVYAFPLSRIGAMFYGPRFGLKPDEWITGVCDRNETRSYIRDVDRYRGVSRLWVLSGEARPFRAARAAVRSYLAAIGVKRDSLELPSLTWGSAGIELYDLSDTTRLRTVSAEAFPVLPAPTDPRPGCRPWARPSPLDRPF